MEEDKLLEALQNVDFWRNLLGRYEQLPPIGSRAVVINNCKNLFNGSEANLNLHLQDRKCYDDHDNEWELGDYVALLEGIKPEGISQWLLHQAEKWLDKKENEEELAFFWYSKKDRTWWQRERKGSEESKMICNFNLMFLSIIKIYNPETQLWERYYECYIEFMNGGRPHKSQVFKLTPQDCMTAKNLQSAVWQIDFRQVFFNNDTHVQFFLSFLNDHYRPRVVVQFDHFGFIKYERRNYYLAQNVLVKIPEEKNDSLQLVAPDEHGCYLIHGDNYIQLDPSVKNAPVLNLGPVDPDSNLYLEDMELLRSYRDPIEFKSALAVAEGFMCDMIGGGGDRSHYGEGRILLAYVFSFHFFEDIYKTWSHVLFMYLYGSANTGKGKMAEVLLTFFGIPTIASITQPTIRALENALGSFSQIPTWIDEFVPEIDGKRSKISDQLFNVWFELRTRQTSSGSNRRRNEEKIVRTMIMFCSNFLPQADHLNSRTIKLEYAHFKRGSESSYHWLMEHRRTLQLLFLAYMDQYPSLDRKFFRTELHRYKKILKEGVTKALEEKSKATGKTEFHLEDRQIQQMAALCVVYNEIFGKSRGLKQYDRKLQDDSLPEMDRKMFEQKYKELSYGSAMYPVGVNFLVTTAQEVSERDPLSDFFATVGYLVSEGQITQKHYCWDKDGSLKMWFAGIWAAYEKFKGQNVIPKDIIRRKLEAIADSPVPKTVNWKPEGFDFTQRQKGYRIPDAKDDKRIAYAFKSPHIEYSQNDLGF